MAKNGVRASLAAIGLLLFCPLTSQAESLTDILVAAYNQHPQLMAQRASVKEIDESFVQAAAQGRFTASGNASLSILGTRFDFLDTANGGVISSDDIFFPRSVAITGQWPLYQGGRVKSLKNQAEFGIFAARENLRHVEQNILLEAATAYVNLKRDEEIAGIRRNNISVLSRQLEAAQERFKVGVGTRTDIAQAEARIAAAHAALASAEAAVAASRASVMRVSGFVPISFEDIPDYNLPDTLEAAQQMASTFNPQLEASRFAIDAARYGIDVAEASYRPSFSLQSFAQIDRQNSSQLPAQDSLGVTANLTIPLITGGLGRSQQRASQAAHNRATFEMRHAEQLLKEQVSVLWAQREAAERRLDASYVGVEAAELAFEGVQIEREVGTRTAIDVLDSDQERLEARLAVTQAQAQLDILEFQILTALGAFDALSLKLPANIYNPQDNFDAVTGYRLIDDFKLTAEKLKETVSDLKDQ